MHLIMSSALPFSGMKALGLGLDRRSSPTAAQRCAKGAGLDGMARRQATVDLAGRNSLGHCPSHQVQDSTTEGLGRKLRDIYIPDLRLGSGIRMPF